VRQLIHEVLYRLVKSFPNQVLWSMTAMARSTHPERASAAQCVLDRAREGAPASVRPLFDHSASLADQLIRVCAFQPRPGRELIDNKHSTDVVFRRTESALRVSLHPEVRKVSYKSCSDLDSSACSH